LRKVPRKRSKGNTNSTRVWGHSLFNISSPVPLFYGTRKLSWRPYKQILLKEQYAQ
jgi:hypothetical protein